MKRKMLINCFLVVLTLPVFAQFSLPQTLDSDYVNAYGMMGIADLDLDGREDIIILKSSGFWIWPGEEDLNFGEPFFIGGYNFGDYFYEINYKVADVDQNGFPDLLVSYNSRSFVDSGNVYGRILPPEAPSWGQGYICLVRNYGGFNFSAKQFIASNLGPIGDFEALNLVGNEELEIFVASGLYARQNYEDSIMYMNYNDEPGRISYFTNHSNQDSVFSEEVILSNILVDGNSIEVNDIDNDGDIDVVFSTLLNGKPGWIENMGSAVFDTIKTIETLDSTVYNVRIVDLNNDGLNELIYFASLYEYNSNFNYGYSKIIQKQGLINGAFGLEEYILDSIYVYNADNFKYIDAENDGDIDIFYNGFTINPGMYLLENDGSGTFVNRFIQRPLVNSHSDFEVIENDADSVANFVTRLNSYLYLRVNPSQENGYYLSINPTDFSSVDNYLLTDIDIDGLNDIVAISGAESSLFYLKNDGFGSFSSSEYISEYLPGLRNNLITADFNADNFEDIAVVSGSNSFVSIFYKQASDTFIRQDIGATNFSSIRHLNKADFNQDGKSDIVLSNYDYVAGKIGIFESNDTLGFAPFNVIFNGPKIGNLLAISDWDNDSFPDLISSRDTNIVWLRNLGNQTFDTARVIYNQFKNSNVLIADDIDLDGDADIVFTSRISLAGFNTFQYNIIALKNEVDTIYTLRLMKENIGNFVSQILLEDLNQDNKKDIIANLENGTSYSIYDGEEWGPFITFNNQFNYGKLVSGDVNMDGRTDIFWGYSFNFTWYLNLFNGTVTTNEITTSSEGILFPNPSNGVFTIVTSGNGALTDLKLLGIDGREMPVSFSQNDAVISVTTQLSPGIYFVNFKDNDGVKTLKLVIQ